MTMAKIPLFSSQKNMACREASREDGNLNVLKIHSDGFGWRNKTRMGNSFRIHPEG